MDQTLLRAPWLQAIARAFADNTVYAVGGAVRNALMDLPVSDVDLCGKLRPEDVRRQCEGTAIEVRFRAAHFGTVELHMDGHMAEYTTFRRDSYRGGHQPTQVQFADTVEEDALRRDFSVNALYTPLHDPTLVIDLVGGLEHLKQRMLHTVTQDPDHVMKDDGLRILRAARFQAELGLTPTEAVLQSARSHVGLLDGIVAERKRDELTKLLEADTKYPTLTRSLPPVSSGLQTLVRVGAWEKLFGSLTTKHLTVLDGANKLTASEKLALLYRQETPETFINALDALRFSKRKTTAAANALTVYQALRCAQSEPADILRFGLDALLTAKAMLIAQGEDLAALQRAESLVELIQARHLPANLKELAVRGDTLLALSKELHIPSKRIGTVLTALWRDTVNGFVPNQTDALLDRARMYFIDSHIGE